MTKNKVITNKKCKNFVDTKVREITADRNVERGILATLYCLVLSHSLTSNLQ